MGIDVRKVSKTTEDQLNQFIKSKYGKKRKKGKLSETVEDALLFFLENQEDFEKWKKEKNLKIKTLKNSFQF